MTKLCSEAMTDHSLDCWQYSFGVGTGFVSVLGQLTRSRDMLQSMASISRLFAARWAVAGSIDSVIAIPDQAWDNVVAFEAHRWVGASISKILDHLRNSAQVVLVPFGGRGKT